MNQKLSQVFGKIPKTTKLAREIQSKFKECLDALNNAIKSFDESDDQSLKESYLHIQKILIVISQSILVPNYEKNIQYVNLTKNQSYQNLKIAITKEQEKLRNVNQVVAAYMILFYKYFQQFNTLMHDIDEPYITQHLQEITDQLFVQYKNALKQQANKLNNEQLKQMEKPDFDQMLKKVLYQTYLFKLVTCIQTGKPADILDLIDDEAAKRYLTPALDEYKDKVNGEKQLLQDEMQYFINILGLNGLALSEEDLKQQLQEKKLQEMIDSYKNSSNQ